MTIYVDGITQYPADMTKGLPGKNWCHMVSDVGEEELHAFAARIGMKRSWFQGRPKASAAHYDLVPSRRALAVKLGAVEVTSRELVKLNFDSLAKRPRCGKPTPNGPCTVVKDHATPCSVSSPIGQRLVCIDVVPGADPDQIDRDVRRALEILDAEDEP